MEYRLFEDAMDNDWPTNSISSSQLLATQVVDDVDETVKLNLSQNQGGLEINASNIQL